MRQVISIFEKLDVWDVIYEIPDKITIEFNKRNNATRYKLTDKEVELSPFDTVNLMIAITSAIQRLTMNTGSTQSDL